MLRITTTLPLDQNECAFENDINNKGKMFFCDPFPFGELFKVTVWGKNVGGFDFPDTTIRIDVQETINPSKVAKWLLKKLAATFNSNDAT